MLLLPDLSRRFLLRSLCLEDLDGRDSESRVLPSAELMLVPRFWADFRPDAPPFARDSGVAGGVGTWYRGAARLLVLACCVDGAEFLSAIDFMRF